MLSDLEDDYAEFPDEMAGLRWDAFDRMDADSLHAVEFVRCMTDETFDATDVAALDPMGRWAYAIRARHDLEAFCLALNLVLEDATMDDYVDAAALTEYAVWNFVKLGASDECRRYAQMFASAYPDDVRLPRIHAWSQMREEPAKADDGFRAWADNDPECMFEVAEDWAAVGNVERARAWLAATRQAATDGHAVHIDCELLAESLLNHER